MTKEFRTLEHNPKDFGGVIFNPSFRKESWVMLTSVLPNLMAERPTVLPKNALASPDQLCSLLEEAINSTLASHTLYHSPEAFSRHSEKLNLENLVDFIYYLQSSTLNIQIARFCGYNEHDMFCASSLSEARAKLSPDFFKAVFDYVSDCLTDYGYKDQYWHGLTLIGIDGCTLPLENFCKTDEDRVRTKNPNRPRAGCHLVCGMNLCSRLYEEFEIQPIKYKDERKAAHLIASRLEKGSVLVMDRGFHSFSTEAGLIASGQDFVQRIKKKDFYSLLQIPEENNIDEEIDIFKQLILTSHYRTEYKNDALHHRNSGKDKAFLNENGEYSYRFRLLKIKLDDDSWEYVLTTLREEDYTLEQIKEIYHMRWLIETSFLELKYEIGLLAVHARKMDSIRQEIYAALTLYNLSNCVIRYCEESRVAESRRTKYEYRLNRKFAIEMCRDFFSWRFEGDEKAFVRMIQKKENAG